MIPPRISIEKLKGIFAEGKYLSNDYVEALATPVIEELTAWANDVVFSRHAGNLTWEIPLDPSANASAVTKLSDPMSPIVRINLGMLKEIYRDAFVFPIVSQQIAEGTSHVKNLNNLYQNKSFVFDTGVPPIPSSQYTQVFQRYKPLYDESTNEDLTDDMLAARFLMFELMVVWLYFHELGHLLQRHYLFQVVDGSEEDVVTVDESKSQFVLHSEHTDENFFLKSQAREILADLEGVSLAVTYMIKKNLFEMPGIYMLMCGQEIMFHRFFQVYADDFSIPDLKHPNPLVRSEYVQAYFTNLIVETCFQRKLVPSRESISVPVVYLSSRSSTMAGLYWAIRYEKLEENEIPAFIRLSGEQHHEPKAQYLATMNLWISNQLEEIKANHLMSPNFISYFEGLQLFKQADSSSTG
ncbi:hypothetical protein [Pseudomonas putida]|uniref:hypothetical protein n=1 Tax=Pseudomonas putida TaxID=303 RepID=UPI000EF6E74F|nr:hypothetical protein [Pseudomonas putida]AYN11806.1 hypothetical protein CHN49_18800 [Pseudomonas putida]